jgi:hypothetical protein
MRRHQLSKPNNPGGRSKSWAAPGSSAATGKAESAVVLSPTRMETDVPPPMCPCLGLGKAFPVVKGRRANRCTLHIRAFDGSRHPVTMCALPGTPHRRLSEGWRAFCAHARMSIGDTVHFYCSSSIRVGPQRWWQRWVAVRGTQPQFQSTEIGVVTGLLLRPVSSDRC